MDKYRNCRPPEAPNEVTAACVPPDARIVKGRPYLAGRLVMLTTNKSACRIDATHARQLAAELLKAADEADAMTGATANAAAGGV